MTNRWRVAAALAWIVSACGLLTGCGGGSASTPKTITGIAISGAPIKVFDHTKDKQEAWNIPDAAVSAWRDASGQISMVVPHRENYRMTGPDLEHLKIEPHKIFSSAQSSMQIPEADANYTQWLLTPYTLDGTTIHMLTHMEWYGCLLNGDCAITSTDGNGADTDSWVSSASQMISTDGGANFHLDNTAGSHVAASPGYKWTGTTALNDRIYLHALNHSGLFSTSRLIREGSGFYTIGYIILRDFTRVDPATGIYQAPVTLFGYVLLRTVDLTDPGSWQGWEGGSSWAPASTARYKTFLPMQNGQMLNGSSPQIVYDTVAQCYILIHTIFGGSNAVYYMTTRSLASPKWSDTKEIAGTASLVTDPGGPVKGFNDQNYISLLDDASEGINFETTSGSPQLFYNTSPGQYGGDNLGRDIYRLQLTISYR